MRQKSCMEYTFTASGHPNITAAHPTTLEFTKDTHLTLQGDCIVGINADFDTNKLKEFLKNERVAITISAGNLKETIIAQPNPTFNDEKEMVIRKGIFISPRTFAINADKGAIDIKETLTLMFKKNRMIKIRVAEKDDRKISRKQQKIASDLKRLMKKGFEMGCIKVRSRDELHERG